MKFGEFLKSSIIETKEFAIAKLLNSSIAQIIERKDNITGGDNLVRFFVWYEVL